MVSASLFVWTVIIFVAFITGGGQSQTTSSTGDQCVDRDSGCRYYRREDVCQGLYRPWASANCRRYCGFCLSTEEEICEDVIDNCELFEPCEDPVYHVWVEDHCRKFCNHCGDVSGIAQSTPKPVGTTSQPTTAQQFSATTVLPACRDQLTFCNQYSMEACTNRDWAINYCPLYCNLCDYVTTESTAPPPTTVGERSTFVLASQSSGAPGQPTIGPSLSPTCRDQLATCNVYSRTACDDDLWARTYCAAFCNVCEM